MPAGVPRTEETKEKIRKFNLGRKHPPRSEEARKNISVAQKKRFETQDVWNKGIKWIENRGENHPNWNGGSGTERHQAMGKIEYKTWRKFVFERDNYTCQECNQRGGELQADHIKPWATYPELRYELDNGRTLCVDCHRKTDTWGNTKKIKEHN
jgi:hypothetical protein